MHHQLSEREMKREVRDCIQREREVLALYFRESYGLKYVESTAKDIDSIFEDTKVPDLWMALQWIKKFDSSSCDRPRTRSGKIDESSKRKRDKSSSIPDLISLVSEVNEQLTSDNRAVLISCLGIQSSKTRQELVKDTQAEPLYDALVSLSLIGDAGVLPLVSCIRGCESLRNVTTMLLKYQGSLHLDSGNTAAVANIRGTVIFTEGYQNPGHRRGKSVAFPIYVFSGKVHMDERPTTDDRRIVRVVKDYDADKGFCIPVQSGIYTVFALGERGLRATGFLQMELAYLYVIVDREDVTVTIHYDIEVIQ